MALWIVSDEDYFLTGQFSSLHLWALENEKAGFEEFCAEVRRIHLRRWEEVGVARVGGFWDVR